MFRPLEAITCRLIIKIPYISCNKLFSNSCLVFNLNYYKFVVLDVHTLLFSILKPIVTVKERFYLFIYVFIYLCIYLFTYSFIHSFSWWDNDGIMWKRDFIYLCIYLFNYSFIHSVGGIMTASCEREILFLYLFMYLFIYVFIYLLIHSFIQLVG